MLCVGWLWKLYALYLAQWNLLVRWEHSYSNCRSNIPTLSTSSLGCKFCHAPPHCIISYNGIIYYVVHKLHSLSRMAIHLGIHNHLIMDGKCKESLEEIRRLIVEEVNHTPDMKMSLIFLSVSKTFWLDICLMIVTMLKWSFSKVNN
jgi:hypothetical protein